MTILDMGIRSKIVKHPQNQNVQFITTFPAATFPARDVQQCIKYSLKILITSRCTMIRNRIRGSYIVHRMYTSISDSNTVYFELSLEKAQRTSQPVDIGAESEFKVAIWNQLFVARNKTSV